MKDIKAALETMLKSLPESGYSASAVWSTYAEEYADSYSKQEHARIRVRQVEAKLLHAVA